MFMLFASLQNPLRGDARQTPGFFIIQVVHVGICRRMFPHARWHERIRPALLVCDHRRLKELDKFLRVTDVVQVPCGEDC